ncbi:MAG: hypothetical protein RSD63_02885 [Eubacterium sp.]
MKEIRKNIELLKKVEFDYYQCVVTCNYLGHDLICMENDINELSLELYVLIENKKTDCATNFKVLQLRETIAFKNNILKDVYDKQYDSYLLCEIQEKQVNKLRNEIADQFDNLGM